ncbi:unnamed protein product [Closterium sp. Naga37s-1]|nr:unnamed protein product [Closterium sp. Naga37s-1]
MERPAEEVAGAIHRIVQNADLPLQAATIRRVFAPSALLNQPLLACRSAAAIENLLWLRSVTAIYWYFTVADIIYDVTRPDRLAMRGTLCVRPWLAPLTTRQLQMVAVLRLEPHEERVRKEGGVTHRRAEQFLRGGPAGGGAAPRRRTLRLVRAPRPATHCEPLAAPPHGA